MQRLDFLSNLISLETVKISGGWLAASDRMQASKPKPTNHRVTSRTESGLLARRRIPSERTFQRDAANLGPTRAVCGHGRGDQQPLWGEVFPGS